MQVEEAREILENVLKEKEYGLCEITDTFYETIETVLSYIDTIHKELDRLEGIEDNTSMLKYELENKDKVIDEMVEIISNVTVPQEKCKQCIKEYFYKKVSDTQ